MDAEVVMDSARDDRGVTAFGALGSVVACAMVAMVAFVTPYRL